MFVGLQHAIILWLVCAEQGYKLSKADETGQYSIDI